MDLKELDYIVTVANEGEHLPRGRKIVYGAVKLKSGSPPI